MNEFGFEDDFSRSLIANNNAQQAPIHGLQVPQPTPTSILAPPTNTMDLKKRTHRRSHSQ